MIQKQLYKQAIFYEFVSKNSTDELVVLVHPLGMNRKVWDATVSTLSENYSVLTLDLPGHGESRNESQAAPYTIIQLATLVKDLAQSLGYVRFHYVGTSIGGAIGQELLLSYPECLRSLLVTNTSHQIGTTEAWNLRADNVRATGLQTMAGDIVVRWFANQYLKNNGTDVQEWQSSLATVGDEQYALLCEALGSWSATERLKNYAGELPVMCLAGEEDPAMPLANMQSLADLFNVSLTTMKLGHVPSVEAPKAFSALLLDWLQRA